MPDVEDWGRYCSNVALGEASIFACEGTHSGKVILC